MAVESKIPSNSGQSPLTAPSSAPTSSLASPVIDELTFNTTPNQLTLLRILFVPGVIFCLWQKKETWDYAAAAVFLLASLTDFLDGYLARKYNTETVYGRLMDPLADKFLVICSLIMLQSLGKMPALVVMVLVCRELTITGLRALASAEGVIVSASQGGKWKTATQMISLPCLMLPELFGIPFYTIGLYFTYFSLALSLWSAQDYIIAFFQGLKKSRAIRKQLKYQKKLTKKNSKKKKRRLFRSRFK